MIAQRSEGAAPVMRGSAEAIPLRDDSVDAAMAILSDHHWSDRRRGITEMRRVARERVVLFNCDPADFLSYWFTAEYLPGFVGLVSAAYQRPGYWEQELRMLLGQIRVERVPIPHDCLDGFFGAYWRRPEAFLEEKVRDGISVFSNVPCDEVERAIGALRADLDSGLWHDRHTDLLEREELDLGYKLVIAEFE
jgi:SAM-dependent methyltransferase